MLCSPHSETSVSQTHGAMTLRMDHNDINATLQAYKLIKLKDNFIFLSRFKTFCTLIFTRTFIPSEFTMAKAQ